MKGVSRVIVIGALGYFVDIYDLVLFSILRVSSLKGIGVPDSELLSTGVQLLNSQMLGMLVGGIFWGILGDKRGRVSVLFGSILMYSAANIANAFVTSVPQYTILRFIAGVGLSGELGAAITLVSEVMSKEKRGYGTAIVAGVGLSGAVFAGLVGDMFSWKVAYIIGGCLGFLLLILRIQMLDSPVFQKMQQEKEIRRGDLRLLFQSRARFSKYLYGILIGVPIWYVVGILVTFCPEIGKALGAVEPLSPGKGIFYTYAGISIGDILSGFISQWWKSRKKVVLTCLCALAGLELILLFSSHFSASYFYTLCFFLGLVTGYWAVFVTISAEQFGTNLRATVATSTPNFVRGSVVLITSAFQYLKDPLGIQYSALAVGISTIMLALWALSRMQETFGVDLDYIEK